MGRTKQTVNRAGRGFRAIEVDGWMEATRENLEMLLVKELKDELRFHGLRKGGRKSELIDYILETIPTIRTVAVPTRIQGWRNPATGEWKPEAPTVKSPGRNQSSRGRKTSPSKPESKRKRTRSASAPPTVASPLIRFPLMGALAVQYGLQTHFQHKYLSKSVNKLGLILSCEIIKLVIAACALAIESAKGNPIDLFSRKFLRSVALCSVPALIYVVQNICVQTAYSELSTITFNCLNQTKLITTASALFLIKGVKQNKMQMFALALVSAGAMLLSVKDGGEGKTEAVTTQRGVVVILAAAVLSGIAATLSQIFMQDLKLSPFLVTLAMCLVSIVTVGASVASQTAMNGARFLSVFDEWTALSIVPVATQALGGLLVGLVTNYCGSINKGVAFVCGLALSAVCECAITGVMLPWNSVLALVFVSQGSFMYTIQSSKRGGKMKKNT